MSVDIFYVHKHTSPPMFRQVALPPAGSAHPATLAERLAAPAQQLLQAFYPGSRVFRCTFSLDDDGPAECNVAARGFSGANGISRGIVEGQGRTVFVSDSAGSSPAVLSYGEGGLLRVIATVPLEFPADNVEWDAQGQVLLLGTLPVLWR